MVARIIFALYAWDSSPVDITDISQSVVDIYREFPFPIEISPARPSKGNSEVKQA